MNLDLHESVPDRNIALEERKLTELSTEYQDKYIKRMYSLRRLKKVFTEDNSFNGVNAGHHLMFKFICDENGSTELRSKDGNRAYEFLIEFDMEDTAYGIYYGCRGLIKGGDQEEQIALLQSEWDEILMGEVCNVLNNTFVDKDFSGRFQKTNNANNKTYWPFWISLYEDEDIITVAARAVQLMYKVYRRYLVDGILPENRDANPKVIEVRTRYTQDAFDQAMSDLDRDGTKYMFDSAKAKTVLQRFLRNAARAGRYGREGIVVDTRYEKCWRFTKISNVQAGFLLAKLTERMGVREGNANIPWRYFTDYLLSEKDEPLDSIRQSYTQSGLKRGDSHMKWARQYLDRILG